MHLGTDSLSTANAPQAESSSLASPLTCAHLTLPFGTLLTLRNPRNGREIVVEVPDRGPFFPGRDLDLSEMAAFKLGILRKGLALLTMEIGTQK